MNKHTSEVLNALLSGRIVHKVHSIYTDGQVAYCFDKPIAVFTGHYWLVAKRGVYDYKISTMCADLADGIKNRNGNVRRVNKKELNDFVCKLQGK